nr:nicotinate-nucleotide--dimethylbenzimidazole phosphoribosyltransferase [uncultured Caproiciproducens sp.]
MTLEETIHKIAPLNQAAMDAAQKRWNSIAKPLNSLGLLEKAVIQIAGITANPQISLAKRGVVVMCADNGVVAQGVTQTGSEVTAVVTENLTKCETSVCKMAQVAGAQVFPVDIGVARDVSGDGLIIRKVAYGTQDMTETAAMTRQQAVQALEIGINLVGELKAQGYKILATGEMGIGNTTTGSAIASVFLNETASMVTGRGAGLSNEGLERKIAAIEKAISVNQPDPEDALDVLAKVGGLDIAGLAGVFLGGAAYRIPVLIDGFISSVAALTAARICPKARDYLMASHVSKEPAGAMLLTELGTKPFLMAEMCLGEGTGAVAVLPILDMACAVYNSMSTFEQIEIEEYQPQN